MSFVGDLAFSDQRALEQDAAENPATAAPEPGFWDGGFDAVGGGLARGSFEAATAVQAGFNNLWISGLDTAAGILLPEPRSGGTPNVTGAERTFREDQSAANAEMITSLRPSAETSGLAAQIISEVSAVIPRTVGGFVAAGPVGGAIAAGGPAGYSGEIVAESEGIDPGTARVKGLIDAATYGVGAVLPAARIMKSVLPDLAVTTAANVGLGVASRGGTAALLEANGYAQQAQQYKALDSTGLMVDAVLGAAFWGVGRGFRPAAADVDASLAANNGLHHQNGTAPGTPTDPRSSVSHQNALDQAIAQLSRGEPVNVGPMLEGATFIRSDRIGPEKQFLRQQAEQEVFSTARAELEPIAAAGLPNVKDLRTELAGLKRSLDGLDASYRDTAKSFQRQGMTRKQAERATRDSIAEQRQTAETRSGEIEQSLAGNRAAERAGAELAQINRGETPGRLEPQVQQRADEMGSGFKRSALARGVSPDHGAALMKLAGKELETLLRQGGHKVDELAVRAPDQEVPAVAPAKAPEPALVVDGAAAARPDAAPTIEQTAPMPAPAERGTAPEAVADPLANIDQALPDLVNSIMSGERDVQIPTGLLNEDGSAATVSARELLNQADADIARAKNDSNGFLAAALCALRFGN